MESWLLVCKCYPVAISSARCEQGGVSLSVLRHPCSKSCFNLPIWGQFHRAAWQIKLLTRQICLIVDFFGYQLIFHTKCMHFCIFAFLLSKRFCKAKVSAKQHFAENLPETIYITQQFSWLLFVAKHKFSVLGKWLVTLL